MSDTSLSFFRKLHQNDIIWTDRYLGRTPFHPGYICRIRVDDAIYANAHLAHGILLDVGCGIKPYTKVFEPFVTSYLGLEYSPESGYRGNLADFCGDAAALPLADNCVDTILCTEVMEHINNPERSISEFARVLRPGGTLLITAPFVYPIHDEYDFFRYSPDGLAAIMSRYGLAVESVKPHSGTAPTIALMLNLYWFNIGFIWTRWLYPIGVILRPFLWLLCFVINALGMIFEKIIPSNHLSFGHLTVAKKPQIEIARQESVADTDARQK